MRVAQLSEPWMRTGDRPHIPACRKEIGCRSNQVLSRRSSPSGISWPSGSELVQRANPFDVVSAFFYRGTIPASARSSDFRSRKLDKIRESSWNYLCGQFCNSSVQRSQWCSKVWTTCVTRSVSSSPAPEEGIRVTGPMSGASSSIKTQGHEGPSPLLETSKKPLTRSSVLLYAPNIVDYLRILLYIVAFFVVSERRPLVFASLYCAAFALDGVDGYLARRLGQTSAFGAFLDVAIDITARSLMWSLAMPGGSLAALLPCVEWVVFVCTHAQGGAAWKEGCFTRAPPWVATVMANNFRNPLGALVIGGLHFLPLWIWLRVRVPNFFMSLGVIGALLAFGRAYCLGVELWMLSRHLGSLLEEDVAGANHSRAEKSKSQ
eukprot:TRINITY_DN26408_c0_g1_i1.p1 TRINITY_DN26408_c0_g1~~TRINITY_DN26408_c0_g1_i1.p1  ORF type:complete len:377 (+),score=16.98 TRINITY_DN26408_c0_g1_i1:42-1172(+)